jgi:tRNA modification GTPase
MFDTFFALSSGRPPVAIAVIRICGPQARVALEQMVGRVPEPRRVALVRVRDPDSRELIDEGLALWFPGPGTETGEDMAELQLHGGRAVIAAALAGLGKLEGFRPAEPGEFTRRAFENGRLDLTAVEGLADLVAAETEAQRRQAVRQMQGLLGERAEAWRDRLIRALALVEAGIDFSDEGDVPEDLLGPALGIAEDLRGEIGKVLAGAERGERLREGLVVAIAGPPNAGKSTLLNRLARREAAIVSSIPGTTRDVIEVHLDLGGYPVTLLDTAGIRDSSDPIEQEGIRRARQRAGAADLVLWLFDLSSGPLADRPVDEFAGRPVWRVATKADLPAPGSSRPAEKDDGSFRISAAEGWGMEGLEGALAAFAAESFGSGEPALVARERQRFALSEVASALDRAIAEVKLGREDMVAEELRAASGWLGRLTGRIDVESVLDVIFRDFCIGK